MTNTALKIYDQELAPIQRLSRDLASASTTLSDKEARYLVDLYYQMQDNRIRSFGQVRALSQTEEPHSVIAWAGEQSEALENQIKRALDRYTDEHPAGAWAKSNVGIGPVLAAGLCANIGDVTRFTAVGNLWSYCGLVPGQKRRRGEKSTWSSSLKRLAWLIGQSFVKVCNNEDAFYGHLYQEKKTYYQKKNEAGEFAERAASTLKDKRFGKGTDAYQWYSGLWVLNERLNPGAALSDTVQEELKKLRREAAKEAKKTAPAGKDAASEHVEAAKTEAVEAYLRKNSLPLRPMLPPAHIQAMAERYAAKIFISHFWEVSLRQRGLEPPKCYAITILGHVHEIKPPRS